MSITVHRRTGPDTGVSYGLVVASALWWLGVIVAAFVAVTVLVAAIPVVAGVGARAAWRRARR